MLLSLHAQFPLHFLCIRSDVGSQNAKSRVLRAKKLAKFNFLQLFYKKMQKHLEVMSILRNFASLLRR